MKKINVLPTVLIAALLLITGGCATTQPTPDNNNYSASNMDKTQNAKAGVLLSFF